MPAIKSKYAALSRGVLASAGIGVELDSAESSSGAAGVFWDGMNRDKDNIVPLTAFVFSRGDGPALVQQLTPPSSRGATPAFAWSATKSLRRSASVCGRGRGWRWRWARVSVKDSSPHNVLTQMMMIDGLPVLELLATKDDLDVVLLRKERVQRVVNQGSGDLTVHEDVLVSSGSSLTIAAVGSGDLYLKSFTSLTVDELSLESQGSGRLQASFSDFDVKSLSMKVISSGDVTALAAAKGTASLFTLSVEGSGALCLSSGSSLESDQLVIDKIGSGDISLGPRGSCQNAEISTKGSGTIDAGGIQCHNVNVDQLGSADIVVQATGSLSGDVYGRGHLKYYGAAPHSIDNVNYMGLVTADPASSSYHPSGCKAKAFPHLKATADTVGSSAGVAGQSAGEDFAMIWRLIRATFSIWQG
ncbi:hypothetical protein KRP22_006913 [Phytophthora ramorum]|nr:hypothetical protein KRP22_1954 [Phytophthora ramorum]